MFAFSSDNWRRLRPEVDALMALLAGYLGRAAARRGRRAPERDRPPRPAAGRPSAGGGTLHLRVAVDHSGRDAIAAAAGLVAGGPATRASLAAALAESGGAPDVDLMIRTGGERRLSDFLLWACAYAELLFLDAPWPDFAPDDLTGAVADLGRRERRFGGLPDGTADAAHPARAA